jgi:predicted XRE-type DNA-binding protein
VENNITLICTPMTFYSDKDEDACFEWLYKIKSISKMGGIGNELHLFIDQKKLSQDEIVDLLGIFRRYKFKNKKQLEQLKCIINMV